jgi:hypothetical protein
MWQGWGRQRRRWRQLLREARPRGLHRHNALTHLRHILGHLSDHGGEGFQCQGLATQ